MFEVSETDNTVIPVTVQLLPLTRVTSFFSFLNLVKYQILDFSRISVISDLLDTLVKHLWTFALVAMWK